MNVFLTYQRDSAPPHSSRAVQAFLNDTFRDCGRG